jgi:transposase InsO family protein
MAEVVESKVRDPGFLQSSFEGAAHQVTCSMSTVGSCADNAAAESFFGRLKRERVNRRQYLTRAEISLMTSSTGTIHGSGGDSISSNRGSNS